MKTELRFRAWDNKKKIMLLFQELSGKINKGLWAFKNAKEKTIRQWGDDIDVMQFLSIHNGEEIWQGDILEIVSAPISENELIGKRFDVYLINGEINFNPNSGAWRYKKIGNKYENPELAV